MVPDTLSVPPVRRHSEVYGDPLLPYPSGWPQAPYAPNTAVRVRPEHADVFEEVYQQCIALRRVTAPGICYDSRLEKLMYLFFPFYGIPVDQVAYWSVSKALGFWAFTYMNNRANLRIV